MAETVYATVSTPGPPGPTGPAGYSPKFIVAAGAPSAGTGNNGDMYINSTTGDVYGPKTAGAWGAIACNIKGPTGATGYAPQYIVAAGAPAAGVGNNGDMYIDSSTSNVYGPKAGGSWGGVVANIKGSTGATGPQGPPGVAYTPRGAYAAGTTYAQGDEATDAGVLYISLQSSNTGHTPASSPTWWQPVAAGGTQTPWTSNHDANTFKLFNASGIGVGIPTVGGILGQLHVATNTGAVPRGILSEQNSVDTAGAIISGIKNRAGAAIANGDIIVSFGGYGYDGSANVQACRIRMLVEGAVSTGTVSGAMSFHTAGDTERVRITAAGFVGIGTVAPGTQVTAGRNYLTVKGSTDCGVLELVSGAADTDGATIGMIQYADLNSVATDKRVAIVLGSASGTTATNRGGALRFYTKADGVSGMVEWMRIAPNGNIGMGTTGPLFPLAVMNAGAAAGGNQMGVAEFVKDSTHSGVVLGYDSTAGNVATIGANTSAGASSLAFWTFSGSAWGERLRITAAGNVGVGTNNPGNIFAVRSNATSLRGASLATLRMERPAAGNAASISFGGAVAADACIGVNPSSDDLCFGHDNGSAFLERVRITYSGLVRVLPSLIQNAGAVGGNAAIEALATATGDLYVYRSNDTSIIFRMRGSDGVWRSSGAIILT